MNKVGRTRREQMGALIAVSRHELVAARDASALMEIATERVLRDLERQRGRSYDRWVAIKPASEATLLHYPAGSNAWDPLDSSERIGAKQLWWVRFIGRRRKPAPRHLQRWRR